MRATNGYGMRKTESQLIASVAASLAQRRREELTQAFQQGSIELRALLAARTGPPQTIFFMRHGESEANLARRDVPDPNLTKLGLAQAKSWQETIGMLEPDIALVSPLRRAIATALHAFAFEDVPLHLCRYAREIGWVANENTIFSDPESFAQLLEQLPRGDEVTGIEEALVPGADDPTDELASLQRLRIEIAKRPESRVAVVCHFGVIATLCGCRAKNGDIYECQWGANEELRVLQRHKTPLSDANCVCG